MPAPTLFDCTDKSLLLKQIQQALFGDRDKAFQRHIDLFVMQQREQADAQATGFRYHGMVYLHSTLSEYERPFYEGRARTLAESAHPAFADLLRQRDWEQERRSQITQYLVNALNLCRTPQDLLTILPQEVHTYVQDILAQWANTPEGLTLEEADVQFFNDLHANSRQILREHILENMILH